MVKITCFHQTCGTFPGNISDEDRFSTLSEPGLAALLQIKTFIRLFQKL